MDLYLLEAKKPRSAVRQQLKGQFVGRDPENVPGQRVSQNWARRAVRIMKDIGIGRPSREVRYDPHVSYRRQIFEILNKMAEIKGETFMNSLSDQQLRQAIRKLAYNISLSRDMPSRDPKISSITGGHYAGTLTHRAGYIDNDGNVVLEPPGGERKGETLRTSTQHVDVRRMNMGDLAQHNNPYVQNIHAALSQDKYHFQKDTAVVFSSDNKPFYFLGKISKTAKFEGGKEGEYNLVIPRAFIQNLPPFKETYGIKWKNNWRAHYRSQDFAVIDTAQSEIFDQDFVQTLQHKAWKKAKYFYQAREMYKELVNKRNNIQKKYYRQGRLTPYSPEDEKEIEALATSIASFEHAMKGNAFFTHGGMTDRQKRKANIVAQQIREGYPWFVWLVASENQFGILVPERQALKENLNLPQVRNPAQPKIANSVIQPSGREPNASWNLGALKGLGFGPGDLDKFEKELQSAQYRYGNQSTRALTHLWVPLVDLEKYVRLLDLKVHPTDISDYLKASKKLSRTQYVVGRENDSIKVDNKLPFPQYVFTVKNVAFSLVPAAEYLRHFDSPKHGGDRLVHGKGVVKAAPPIRSVIDLRGGGTLPTNLVVDRRTTVYDPAKREQDIKALADSLFQRRFRAEKRRVQAQTVARKRIEARKGLVYVSPGKRPFTGFSKWGERPPVGRTPFTRSRVQPQLASSLTGWRAKAVRIMHNMGIKDSKNQKLTLEKMLDHQGKVSLLRTSKIASPGDFSTKHSVGGLRKYLSDREAQLNRMTDAQLRQEIEALAVRTGFIE